MLMEKDTQQALIARDASETNLDAYSRFFGFQQLPFSSLPKNSYYYQHESAREVINTVIFSLRSGESVVKVTGVSGVGKTYLLRKVVSSLTDEFYFIQNLNPDSSANEFLKSIVEEFGVSYSIDASNAQLIKQIQCLLYEHYSKTDFHVVIWIDDAHRLSDEMLSVIHSLIELETNHRKLLQFILSGNDRLNRVLKKPEFLPLRQKIVHSEVLKTLNFHDMRAYVETRLMQAAGVKESCFSQDALRLLYQRSNGIPRQINLLAHKALLLAFGKGDKKIRRLHVQSALLDGDVIQSETDYMLYFLVFLPMALAAAGVLILLVIDWSF